MYAGMGPTGRNAMGCFASKFFDCSASIKPPHWERRIQNIAYWEQVQGSDA